MMNDLRRELYKIEKTRREKQIRSETLQDLKYRESKLTE